MNGNKFATGQILKKPVEVVKGRIFSWLRSKVSRTLPGTELIKLEENPIILDEFWEYTSNPILFFFEQKLTDVNM